MTICISIASNKYIKYNKACYNMLITGENAANGTTLVPGVVGGQIDTEFQFLGILIINFFSFSTPFISTRHWHTLPLPQFFSIFLVPFITHTNSVL